MRLLPEGIAELDPNIRWDIATRLQLIEDVVLGPQDSGIGTPTMEEATDRMRRAVEARDKKAEDEAIMDYMRAEVMAWLQDFPERQLLTDLYQRAAGGGRQPALSTAGDALHMERASGLPRGCWWGAQDSNSGGARSRSTSLLPRLTV